MNRDARSEWIDNDEGLYDWWKSTRLSKQEFMRQNREEIDAIIAKMASGEKRQHYLKYGG